MISASQPAPSGTSVEDLVATLKMVHITGYFEGREGSPDRLSIDPIVAAPPELMLALKLAREQLVSKAVDKRKELREKAIAASRSTLSELLSIVTAREYIHRAISGGMLTCVPPPPPKHGGESNGEILDVAPTVPVLLAPYYAAKAPAEVVALLKDIYDINDVGQVDVKELLAKVDAHAQRASDRLSASRSANEYLWAMRRVVASAEKLLEPSKEAFQEVLDLLANDVGINTRSAQSPGDIVPVPPRKMHLAGFGDLKVVRQQLEKYQLGELAHVENVMAGEERERTHSLSEKTEQQFSFEAEEATSSEKDLQSTERLELSQEVSNITEEKRQSDAGVKVTASYGAVSLEAHANRESTESAESAESSARRAMKETISRAVERVQKRSKTSRATTITFEAAEVNRHSFKGGSEKATVGLYRWVEKRYVCQVLSCGGRMMLEFMIPEPAAYFSFSQERSPRTDGQVSAPEEPTFSAAQLDEYNYQAIASRYGALVSSPPPVLRYGRTLARVSGANAESTIEVDADYELASAYLTWAFLHTGNANRALYAFIGGNIWVKTVSTEWQSYQHFNPALRGEIALTTMVNAISNYVVSGKLVLRRAQEAYEKWQLLTYNAIIDAYRVAKGDYDRQRTSILASAQKQKLRTDIEYRTIERQELRRAALELLTEQHFGGFQGIEDLDGIPKINFGNVAAEAPYVQFFEQAFEWNEIVYVFYPYFWGRSKTWEQKLSATDIDQVFSRFLTAGYARLVVPVRPRFESHVAYYAETGAIWSGESAPLPEDPHYLAVVNEIREIDAAMNGGSTEGLPSGEPWQVTVPTPLVCLEADGVKLPEWDVKLVEIPFSPSEETCNGVPYNLAQWPNEDAVVAALKAFGYGVGTPAKSWINSQAGRRVLKTFQKRANELGVASAIGAPLWVDGKLGPCTYRALSVMEERRAAGEWPGPN